MEETQQLLKGLLVTQEQSALRGDKGSHDSGETSTLHSFGVRPRFEWTPDVEVQSSLGLDRNLFNSTTLTDDERGSIIDTYPPMSDTNYQPPQTMPGSRRKMNKGQAQEDTTLRNLQYLISGVFRPLDILGSEICKIGRAHV